MKVRWTEEKIIEWLHINASDYKFNKIIEYKGLNTRISLICPKCNREYIPTFKNFKAGKRCGCDNGKRNHILEDVIEFIETTDLELLDGYGEYSYKRKFKLQCSNGHIFYMRFADLLSGHRCPHCAKNKKLTYKEVYDLFDKYGYELLSKEYINAHSKLLVKCPEGHTYKVRYADFYSGKRCPYCQTSKGENKIKIYLNDYGINNIPQYKFKDCKFKRPLPFDFYLPDYNICIEFDGEQHHKIGCFNGDIWDFVDIKIRDTIKSIYCEDNNIKLIRIPYWEFDNIESILNENLKE